MIKDNKYAPTFININSIINEVIQFQDDLDKVISYLKETKILHYIKEISKICFKTPIMNVYYRSFVSNIRGFLEADLPIKQRVIKYNKTIISYMNFEAISLNMNNINQMIEKRNNNLNVKILYACSTVDMNDTISANKEVVEIYRKSLRNKTNILVIPSFGSTIDVFKTIITKYNIDLIHICGHGSKSRISFVGSNLKVETFSKVLSISNKKYDNIFLNCCYSFEYAYPIKSSILYYNFITYSGMLNDKLAFVFADNFYDNFLLSFNIKRSFSNAFNNKCNYIIW